MSARFLKALAAAACAWLLFLAPGLSRAEEGLLQFRIDAKRSHIEVLIGTPFGVVKGVPKRFSGTITASRRILHPQAGGRLEVEAESIKTGNRLRDWRMRREVLEASQYPKIVFRAVSVRPVQGAEGEFIVRGVLELKGVSQELEARVRAGFTGPELKVQGRVKLDMTKFGIDPPIFLIVFAVEDEVEISFSLVGVPQEGK